MGMGLALGACGADAPAADYRSDTARAVCEAFVERASLGRASACEAAIASDCTRVVSTLSEPFLVEVQACIEGEGPPLSCMEEAGRQLAPRPIHREVAAAFCSECAHGVAGCEQGFYADDSRWGLGTALLPLSEPVLATVRDDCASGPFCAVDFATCVEDVLLDRIEVEEAGLCLAFEVVL